MGDYVLESNPALERLIERLGASGKPPPAEDGSRSKGKAARFKRRRRSTVHAADRSGILLGNPTTAGANDVAVRSSIAEPAATAKEITLEDNVWAIPEEVQTGDEIVLVDFDEEPEVFDEDPGDHGEDGTEADEADELIDVYDLDELYGGDGTSYEGAEDAVDVAGVEHEGGDWILDAFKVWMLETVETH